jgi:chromosome segregation ATPase
MKKEYKKSENQRLKEELSKLNKKNEKLSQKLDKSKSKNRELKQDLKKNDVRKISINKEQEQLLSSQLKDTDILNLLSD